MAGREHHVEGALPGVVCREPPVERVDLDVRGKLRPYLIGHDKRRAMAGECSLDGRHIERALAALRRHVSAGSETSDGATEGRSGH